MIKFYYCRINNQHQFKKKAEKLAHEKKCPDLPNSKYKICIYNQNHIISKDIYENHIQNLCSNKQEKINIEKTTREYAYTWLMWKLANDK